MKSKKWIALSFLGIIAVFFVCNAGLMGEPMEKYFSKEINFIEFRNDVRKKLESDQFSFENQFINFNGKLSKLLGRQVINDVVVADNGVLFQKSVRKEMGLSGQKLAHTNAALRQIGIPFVYVQAPAKVDLNKEMLPVGIKDYYNDNADSLIAELECRDVKTIDLRPCFSSTAEDVKRYFYKTDHHWNYQAAFEAFQILVPEIQSMLDDDSDVSLYTEKANWETRCIPQSFLGSQGKRVGLHVTGLDDFEYYVPKFETDMTLEVVDQGIKYEGNFETCIIRKEKLEEYQEYFKTSIYSAFIGSDYALVRHRNKKPAINKRILIVKDSFVLPLQAFLSTVFEEIYVVDLRHYKDGSLLKLIEKIEPDMSFILHSQLHELKNYNYGYEEYNIDNKLNEVKYDAA